MSKRPSVWIEQANEEGDIFTDTYLHPECEYIRQWTSREVWLKEIKDKQTDKEYNAYKV